jgi:hypothetical protein
MRAIDGSNESGFLGAGCKGRGEPVGACGRGAGLGVSSAIVVGATGGGVGRGA